MKIIGHCGWFGIPDLYNAFITNCVSILNDFSQIEVEQAKIKFKTLNNLFSYPRFGQILFTEYQAHNYSFIVFLKSIEELRIVKSNVSA